MIRYAVGEPWPGGPGFVERDSFGWYAGRPFARPSASSARNAESRPPRLRGAATRMREVGQGHLMQRYRGAGRECGPTDDDPGGPLEDDRAGAGSWR